MVRQGRPSQMESSSETEVVVVGGLGETLALWSPVIERLDGKGIRFEYYEPGGFLGQSSAELFDVQHLAEDLRLWLRSRGLHPALVVSHSLGTAVVEYLARNSELRAAAILYISPLTYDRLNSTVVGSAFISSGARRSRKFLLRILNRPQDFGISFGRFGSASSFASTVLSLSLEQGRRLLWLGPVRSIVSSQQVGANADISACAIVVAVGTLDYVQRHRSEGYFKGLYGPVASLVLIRGAAHAPHRTHPGVVATLISEILDMVAIEN